MPVQRISTVKLPNDSFSRAQSTGSSFESNGWETRKLRKVKAFPVQISIERELENAAVVFYSFAWFNIQKRVHSLSYRLVVVSSQNVIPVQRYT